MNANMLERMTENFCHSKPAKDVAVKFGATQSAGQASSKTDQTVMVKCNIPFMNRAEVESMTQQAAAARTCHVVGVAA